MASSKPKPKKFLFISRAAPYGSNRAQMCLDVAFASAVFEQDVSYLFMDDGVFQLLTDQNAEGIHSKTLGNILETLDLYGIEKIYVDRASLQNRQLTVDDLLLGVETVDGSAIGRLINNSDCVVNL